MQLMKDGAISPVWKGETAVIFGGGPSLTIEQVEYCKGKAKTLCVNDTYRLAPWADALYACDGRWWAWHPDALEFTGCKITQDKRAAAQHAVLNHIECLTMSRHTGHKLIPGLSTNPSIVHSGQNGGYQALNIAFLAGASRIILLGYDMKHIDGKSHWFGDHPNGDRDQVKYKRWIQNYATVAAQRLNVDVINCSPQSALDCFRRGDLMEVL